MPLREETVWCHPYVCVNLCGPNKAVLRDSYPLLHIDQKLSLLHGVTVFSTIDLERVYFQLPLHEDSRDLTAFITQMDCSDFVVAHMGHLFSIRLPDDVVHNSEGSANYSDDVVIWGCTRSEHDETLEAVLQHLQEAGLLLNTPKCHFNRSGLHTYSNS